MKQMEDDNVPILRADPQEEIEMPTVPAKIKILPMSPNLSCNGVCPFSKLEKCTSESQQRSKSAKKLFVLILFYLVVMSVEFVGGIKANSLAVITDAGHLLSDIAGFSISLFSVWASGWKATSGHSFGYHRLEVLGALLSVQLIWLISGILIYEAVDRMLQKNVKVNGTLMFAIAAFGFVLNLVMVLWLGHDHHHHACGHHDHEMEKADAISEEEKNILMSSSSEKMKTLNINLQGAYLHVMVDMIQSIGVMISGAIIWRKPEWLQIDLICTLIFSVVSLTTTISMLRNVYGILMERTPSEIDVAELENGLKRIQGVQDFYDLHIWALTAGKTLLSCHVVAEPTISSSQLVYNIRDYCERRYRIQHVTIQIEEAVKLYP